MIASISGLVRKPSTGLSLTLRRNCQAVLDGGQGREVVMGGVLQERSDRRQTGVAATYAVAAIPLEMIEEAKDQRRIQISERQTGWRLADALLRIEQEQFERVAVGCDRVRADGPLLVQMVDEEVLQQRRER
jgi:hypothetical protein